MAITPLHDYPTFGRVATWDEWLAATAQSVPDFLFPNWIISNMLGFVLLWMAIAETKHQQRLQMQHHTNDDEATPTAPLVIKWISARQVWGFLMMLAAIFNTYIMMKDPYCYLEFGVLAIPPLQRFIYSPWFASPPYLVYPIAAGQMWIGYVLWSFPRHPTTDRDVWYVKAALIGILIWFFGIAPLGMASGFPAGLIYASTMMLCWPTEATTK